MQHPVRPRIDIDHRLCEAIIDGHNVALTSAEWRVFHLLHRQEGGWLKEQVIRYKTDVQSPRNAIIDLRNKFGPGVVLSRRGFGYRLNM